MARSKKRRAAGAAQARSAQQQRKKRRRSGKRTLHYILLLIFLVSAGVVLSLTVFFKIEKIDVIGVDKYDPQDIIEATGIQYGENLLRLKTAGIEEAILERFPYIESVAVKRRFPPAVEIQVTQATPEGAAIDDGEIALITMEGKILERGDVFIPPELPLINGLELTGYKPGEVLGEENEERLTMLRYLFEAADKIGFGPITNVDLTDRLNMKMVYEARLLLVLGSEADMEYKLTFLQEVIGDLDPDDQARLDASNAANKRILVKYGTLENGVFVPGSAEAADKVVTDGQDGQAVLAASEPESAQNKP